MRCNTVSFKAADGKTASFPLRELLDRRAVIASKVGGEDIAATMGGFNQLWVRGWPAKHFIRDIVDIRFTSEDEPPQMEPFEDDGRDFTNRPNVSVRADYVGRVGEALEFEGYADDYDRAIVGVQFSLDEGATWTMCETPQASAGCWVRWRFAYTPERPGSYVMKVRAVAEDGTVSPIAAVHAFEVTI